MGAQLTRESVEAGTKDTVAALLENYDAFLFDCDGTLYHAGNLLPHVAETINLLKERCKKVFFVTNTSSRSSEQLQRKLVDMGVPCEAKECVPSGVFTAFYIKKMHPDAKKVYVVGGQGVVDELRKQGIESSGGPSENKQEFEDTKFEALAKEVASEKYDGVVVGWDTALNYYKIVKSSLVFQQHPDCFFYATNDDLADRVGSCLLPGNGCLLATLEAACKACAPERQGKSAPFGTTATSLGKPNPDYARLIAEWNDIDLKRTVMVGDRLDTDIEMGIRAGMGSCFVLTGVDGLGEITRKGIRPKYVLSEVGCLWTDKDLSAAPQQKNAGT